MSPTLFSSLLHIPQQFQRLLSNITNNEPEPELNEPIPEVNHASLIDIDIAIPDFISEEDFTNLECFDGYNPQVQHIENTMMSDESIRMVDGSVEVNNIPGNYC